MPTTYCPRCFGENGHHNIIHIRHEQGGGGSNISCPDSTEPLMELFKACAVAMWEDRELTVAGNGVNSCEAGTALQEVARILGLRGPDDFYGEMEEARENAELESVDD